MTPCYSSDPGPGPGLDSDSEPTPHTLATAGPGSSTCAGVSSGAEAEPTNSSPSSAICATQNCRARQTKVFFLDISILKIFARIRTKSGLVSKIAVAISLVITALALWPTFASTAETKRATLLAEWTAKKDFFEFCESHNWEIDPGCTAMKASPPGPPPVLDSRGFASVPPDDVVSEQARYPEDSWPVTFILVFLGIFFVAILLNLRPFRARILLPVKNAALKRLRKKRPNSTLPVDPRLPRPRNIVGWMDSISEDVRPTPAEQTIGDSDPTPISSGHAHSVEPTRDDPPLEEVYGAHKIVPEKMPVRGIKSGMRRRDRTVRPPIITSEDYEALAFFFRDRELRYFEKRQPKDHSGSYRFPSYPAYDANDGVRITEHDDDINMTGRDHDDDDVRLVDNPTFEPIVPY